MSSARTTKTAIDLTPRAVENWCCEAGDVPVLTVNPEASIHHRLALAWGMASELHDIAEAAGMLMYDRSSRSLIAIMTNRLHDLERLLHSLGSETSRPTTEGGAA